MAKYSIKTKEINGKLYFIGYRGNKKFTDHYTSLRQLLEIYGEELDSSMCNVRQMNDIWGRIGIGLPGSKKRK